ncbi:hypothetical protein AB1Y20_012892 [Prymnesium parvum]|uniref:Uncharacterized protein n=1 Tax=Prymnesium parvum TaxID=97485 RepID=A0AB34IJV5_PRYPA
MDNPFGAPPRGVPHPSNQLPPQWRPPTGQPTPGSTMTQPAPMMMPPHPFPQAMGQPMHQTFAPQQTHPTPATGYQMQPMQQQMQYSQPFPPSQNSGASPFPQQGMSSPFAAQGTQPANNFHQHPFPLQDPFHAQPPAAPQFQRHAPNTTQPATNDFMVPQPLTAPPAAPVMDVSQLDSMFATAAAPASPVGWANDDMFAGVATTPHAEANDEENSEEADANDVELEEGETPKEVTIAPDTSTAGEGKKKEVVLSRQDTWMYMEGLQSASWDKRTEAARALKSLAFNAEPEYKEGLIKAGVCRLLMRMLASGPTNAAIEQATSCMYSLAREHLASKQELVKVGALKSLSELLTHESKQCRLNATATLYAVSCSGRPTCRELAQYNPLPALKQSVMPGIGRNAQDDQLQLFAALLIVNLLHVRGVAGGKQERASLESCLTRAFEDATEDQVRNTINIGLHRIHILNSRKERMKVGAIKRVSRAMSRMSMGKAPEKAGHPTTSDRSSGPPMTGFGSSPAANGSSGSRPRNNRSYSKSLIGGVKGVMSASSNMVARLGGSHKNLKADSADWED